jgi:hypothetical protein
MSTASEMAGRFYCSSLLPADNSLAQFPCLTIVSKRESHAKDFFIRFE